MPAKAGHLLNARVTHLEMTAPPTRHVAAPLGAKVAVFRTEKMPLSFYRYLYREVGKPHHWSLRRDLVDSDLAEAIHAPAMVLQVLYVDGAPAGFFELDTALLPAAVEILYFGLIPEFHGRGLGRFFLSEAAAAAWSHRPRKVTIQTNTLDSPRALRLYQKIGFSAVGWSDETIEAWI